MKVEIYIPGTYTIPDRCLQQLIDEYREQWGDDIELFPGDLARIAHREGIGKIEYDESDFESHEEPLQPEDLPKGVK